MCVYWDEPCYVLFPDADDARSNTSCSKPANVCFLHVCYARMSCTNTCVCIDAVLLSCVDVECMLFLYKSCTNVRYKFTIMYWYCLRFRSDVEWMLSVCISCTNVMYEYTIMHWYWFVFTCWCWMYVICMYVIHICQVNIHVYVLILFDF